MKTVYVLLMMCCTLAVRDAARAEEISSSGTWRGSLTGQASIEGTWSANAVRSAETFAGTVVLSGSPFGTMDVSGRIGADGSLAATLKNPTTGREVSCTSSRGAESMEGQFTCGSTFSGRWTAQSIVRRGSDGTP
jgi:hypothetical protein